MAAVLKTCSRDNCQHKGNPQPIDKFLNKKGRILKGCLDCRSKETKYQETKYREESERIDEEVDEYREEEKILPGHERFDEYREGLGKEEKILFDNAVEEELEDDSHVGPDERNEEEVDEKKSTKSKRIEPKTYSLTMERMLQFRQDGKCRGGSRCELNIHGKKIYHNGPCYENDHRIALHRWDEIYPDDKTGYNGLNNRQLLCGNCHTKKSIFERKMMRDYLNPIEQEFLSRLEKPYSFNEMDEDVSEVQWT